VLRKVCKGVLAMYPRKGDNQFIRKSDVNPGSVDRKKNCKKTEKHDSYCHEFERN